MREIKFRAWNKEDKVMFDVFGFDVNHVTPWQRASDPKIHIVPHVEDCVLMQYTGFKDVNSKDIYEGDILYFEEGGEFLGYVCWCDGGFFVAGVEEMLCEWNGACSVEGNIYADVERYKQL